MTLRRFSCFGRTAGTYVGGISGQDSDKLRGIRPVSLPNRRIVVVTLLGFVLCIAGIVPTQSLAQEQWTEPTLSLRQALELAELHSPRLRADRSQADAARFGADAARRESLWPTINVGGGFLYDAEQEKRLIPRSRLEDQSMDEAFNSQIYDLQINLSYPIYAPRLSDRFAVQTAAAELANFRALASRDRLLLAVFRTYHRVLLLDRSIRAVEASLAGLGETQRVIARQLELGRLPPIDGLRIDTRVAQVQLERLNLANDRHQAVLGLSALIGQTVNEQVTLKQKLDTDMTPRNRDEAAADALAQRPDLRAARAAVQQAEAKEALARSAYQPTVKLALNGSLYWGNDAGGPVEDYFAGVRLTVPLFEPGLAPAHSQAAFNVNATRHNLAQLDRNIRAEVASALLDIDTARESEQVTRRALDLSREGFRLEQRRFEAGRSTINDVLQAEADMLRAELAHAKAQVGLKIASARLTQVRGEVDIDQLAPLGEPQ